MAAWTAFQWASGRSRERPSQPVPQVCVRETWYSQECFETGQSSGDQTRRYWNSACQSRAIQCGQIDGFTIYNGLPLLKGGFNLDALAFKWLAETIFYIIKELNQTQCEQNKAS